MANDPDNLAIADVIEKIYYAYVAKASELSANDSFSTVLYDYTRVEKEPATARLAYIVQRYIRNRTRSVSYMNSKRKN
ncbi:MAG: hypothetical protein LC687_05285 [Actinobacteria bacterium]|nr:hypothetical protein [Actinomycetota bacterium]